MAGGAASPSSATLSPNATRANLTASFAVVTSLFFMWAVAVNLNDILIPHLKKACNLSDFQSSFIQVAFFGAYFVMALPAGFVMRKYGYARGILLGLGLSALGALLFFPAAETQAYPFFLFALFVMASGSATLETAANPYASVLGPADKSEFRLNLAQTVNGVGAFLTPLFGKAFILSGIEHSDAEISSMTEAQVQAYRAMEASQVKTPYIVLAGIYALLMLVVWRAKLPEIEGESHEVQEGSAGTQEAAGFAFILRHRHTVLGIVTQFFYVGAQVCLASFMIRLTQQMLPGTGEKAAADYLFYHLVGFAAGRLAGTAIMTRLAPAKLLSLYGVVALALMLVAVTTGGEVAVYAAVASGFFNSIMFPTIFALAIKDLGPGTKLASSLLVMSIIGGALLPALMGYVSDQAGIQTALLVPAFCYLVVAFYGVAGYRVKVVKG